MQKYTDIVLGQNGQTLLPIAGAQVTITTSPGGVLATIYSDNGVTIQANPMTTDLNGRFAFYAANGRYTPQYTYLSVNLTLPDIILQDDPTQPNVTVITGGSIDNTPIGATTPSTGVFTTLSATTLNSTSGALNGTVGATTPNTGSFTTLSSTGGALNGTLGATTPSTVSATTIVASGTITPSQTNGIVGTTTNNSAIAGSVGELVTQTTGPAGLTTNVTANLTSISLTAGDWDVSGSVSFIGAAGNITDATGGSSTTSATFGGFGTFAELTATISVFSAAIPTVRYSLAATTTVFLPVRAIFASGSATGQGTIRARRIR